MSIGFRLLTEEELCDADKPISASVLVTESQALLIQANFDVFKQRLVEEIFKRLAGIHHD